MNLTDDFSLPARVERLLDPQGSSRRQRSERPGGRAAVLVELGHGEGLAARMLVEKLPNPARVVPDNCIEVVSEISGFYPSLAVRGREGDRTCGGKSGRTTASGGFPCYTWNN